MNIELIMACATLGIGFLYLFLVTFIPIPTGGAEHAKTIVGFILGTVVATIIQYFWGSSKGSADKSKFIEKQNNGGGQP